MSKVVVDTAGWIRGETEVETVEVSMVYALSDPFAVRFYIRSGGQGGGSAAGAGTIEEQCWTFGRDLLADGLRSMVPVGEGAVQVQATSVLTEVSHATGDGEPVTLRLPWWNTREFVRLTHELVARGDEHVDVDGWLLEITGTQEG